MRIYKYYRFLVGRKMEFKDLFASVDAFLKDRGIHYDSMGYNLEALGDCCQKLVQKMPQFAPIEVIEGPYSTSFRLTNLLKCTLEVRCSNMTKFCPVEHEMEMMPFADDILKRYLLVFYSFICSSLF